jgi:aminotransferase in exopolysaccharide biosynthesis
MSSVSEPLAHQIIDAIRSVIGSDKAALHEPRFKGNEWQYVKDCLDSTFVSTVGKYVGLFEHELASYTGAKHAVAVANGTAALHIALELAGVSEGDEVLVPALTFIATANAVSYCGAIPHFVDSAHDTLGMAVGRLRDYLQHISEQSNGHCVNKSTGKVIRAMVPMHTFGHMADLDGLLAIARDFNIALIEDAAESLGSTYQGKHSGTFGMMGTLSFNGNKTITTGGGGAILTNDSEIAQRAKHLTTTAKVPHRWAFIHDEVGYNYRMPNLNAALGCAQLEQLPVFLASKRQLYASYAKAFEGMTGVSLMKEPTGSHSNYWLQTIMLSKPDVEVRDAVLQATNDSGIMTRPSWTLMHRLKPYQACPRAPLPVSEDLEQQIINIPSSAFLV